MLKLASFRCDLWRYLLPRCPLLQLSLIIISLITRTGAGVLGVLLLADLTVITPLAMPTAHATCQCFALIIAFLRIRPTRLLLRCVLVG